VVPACAVPRVGWLSGTICGLGLDLGGVAGQFGGFRVSSDAGSDCLRLSSGHGVDALHPV
jgi:hypothetical protein